MNTARPGAKVSPVTPRRTWPACRASPPRRVWATGGKGITQEQQGRLYLNLYRAQFKQGFKQTFIYMLRDAGGSDSGYGMFTTDYQPKKSATYLHNLTTILSDPGSARPGNLQYAIADQPPTVHDLLLQKSDGAFDLVVWNEQADGTCRVTVNLGADHGAVRVYDPTTTTTPIQTVVDTGSVPLTLSDHPVVLELAGHPSPRSHQQGFVKQ